MLRPTQSSEVYALCVYISARDNVRSSDNFRLIMPRDRSYPYTVKAVWLRETSKWQRCCVSAEFNEKLRGMCNYNPAFVVSSKNLRESSYKDHAATDMHKRALLLFKKQTSTDVTEYAPIAKAHSNHLFMSEHDWYLSDQDQ